MHSSIVSSWSEHKWPIYCYRAEVRSKFRGEWWLGVATHCKLLHDNNRKAMQFCYIIQVTFLQSDWPLFASDILACCLQPAQYDTCATWCTHLANTDPTMCPDGWSEPTGLSSTLHHTSNDVMETHSHKGGLYQDTVFFTRPFSHNDASGNSLLRCR